MSDGFGLILPTFVLPKYLETGPPSSSHFAAGANAGANQAVLVRMSTPVAFPLANLVIVNGGTIAGNADLGIYEYGTGVVNRLASTGATAQSGANVDQSFALSYVISAGDFFVAISMSDGTATYFRTAPVAAYTKSARRGIVFTTSHPLPTSIDVSSPTGTGVFPYIRLERT